MEIKVICAILLITSGFLLALGSLLRIFRKDWNKLKSNEIPNWLLKRVRKHYKKRRHLRGKKSHFIGKTYFYRVWYRGGRRDWVFYRKKK